MTAALVNDAQLAWNGNTTSNPTFNFDATGANLLVVKVTWRNSVPSTLTGFTYNGVTMTRIGSRFDSSSPQQSFDYFRLVSPASGSNAIVITANDPMDSGTGAVISAEAYSGADTTTPIGDDQHFEAVTPFTTLTTTLSAATGDICSDSAMVVGTPTSLTATAGQTDIGQLASGTNNYSGFSTKPGAASVTMSWTYLPTLTRNAAQRCIVIKAGAATGAKLLSQSHNQGGF